jgi:hypothetical protein
MVAAVKDRKEGEFATKFLTTRGAPTNVIVTGISRNAVRLQWDPPEWAGNNVDYFIHYEFGNRTWGARGQRVLSNTNSDVVNKLKEGTDYYFTVIGIYKYPEYVDGPPSEEMHYRIPTERK